MKRNQLIYSYLTQWITLIWWVFFLIFLPKIAWVENYWTFMLLLTYISLFWMFMWVPLQEAIKKELAEEKLSNNWKIIISNWYLLRIIINIVFFIWFYFIYNFIEWIWKINYLYILWIFLFINLSWLPQNIFYWLHKNKNNFYFVLIEYSIQISFLLYFYFFTNNFWLEEIILSFIIWYAIPTIFYSFYIFIKYKIRLLNFDINISKELLKRYFWLSISSVSFLLLTNIDNIMISYFYTNLELWYYNIATNIVNKSTIFTIAIVLATLPLFHWKQKKDILKNNFKKYLFWIIWLNTLLWISIYLLAWFWVRLIYWSWYDLSIQIMQIIFLFPLFAVLQTFFSWILTNFWNYKLLMFVSLWIALLNIVLNYIFINIIWLIWVSIATIFSYFVWSLILGLIIKNRFINN